MNFSPCRFLVFFCLISPVFSAVDYCEIIAAPWCPKRIASQKARIGSKWNCRRTGCALRTATDYYASGRRNRFGTNGNRFGESEKFPRRSFSTNYNNGVKKPICTRLGCFFG